MAKVNLIKSRDSKKEKIAIAIAVFLLVIVVSVWFFQVKLLFSGETLKGYSQNIDEIKNQVAESIEYSEAMNESVPGFNSDLNVMIDDLQETFDEQNEANSKDLVVEGIAKEIEKRKELEIN